MKNLAKKVIISRLNNRVKKLLATHNITVIGVTGSVGKTGTKKAIGEVLSATRKVRYSRDSYNTDIGIPLSLFGLKVPGKLWNAREWSRIFKQIDSEIANYKYDTVVLELADDELNMMKKVLSIVKLDISVISAVAPVHMEFLKDMQTVVYYNWQIAAHAKKIIYNADSDELRKKAYKKDTIGFGLKYGNVKFAKVSRGKNGYLNAQLKIGKKSRLIHTKMLGEQNLYGLLAAAAVATELEIPFEAICFELEQVKTENGRMNKLKGKNGSTLIDDSYNASAKAVIAALDTLKDFKTNKSAKKYAILGSMNELGEHSIKSHQEVGAKAAEVVDMLITIGKNAEKYMATAANHAGLASDKIKVFRTPYEAGHYLKQYLNKGDIVLIKGSQGDVFSEEATRILLDDKIDASKVLVRQSEVWKKRKKKSFATVR